MLTDEIKAILEKNAYELDSDVISRIQTMMESLRDDNQIHKLDYIISWFNKKREESDMVVEEIGINDLDKWNVDSNSGNLKHESGGFFEVIGIKASNVFDALTPITSKNPPDSCFIFPESESTLHLSKSLIPISSTIISDSSRFLLNQSIM